MALSPLPPEIQQLLDLYMNSGPEQGIPNELRNFAAMNPQYGIDRSGNQLSVDDTMFNFYNPMPDQAPDSWFYNDDRNNPYVNGEIPYEQPEYQDAARAAPVVQSSPLNRLNPGTLSVDSPGVPPIVAPQPQPQPQPQSRPPVGGFNVPGMGTMLRPPGFSGPGETAPGLVPIGGDVGNGFDPLPDSDMTKNVYGLPTDPANFGSPATTTPTGDNGGASGGEDDILSLLMALGQFQDIPNVPTISSTFSDAFKNDYMGFMDNLAWQGVNKAYDYQLPTAQSAQINTGNIPQPTAQQARAMTPESFAQLEFLLSGQGYKPETLAAMRAQAGEDISGSGITRMSQAKRALGQSGLSGSPAAAAIQEQVARDSERQRVGAMRDIDIENARVGMDNMRMGTEMESNRRALGSQLQTNTNMSNMAQANAMALANASNMLSALQQNAQMQQQANMAQFGAEADRKGNQASATANSLQNMGQAYQTAQLGKAVSADEQNVANQRQRDMFNSQGRENRWHAAFQPLANSAFGANPVGFANNSSNMLGGANQNPLGNVAGNVGGGILQELLKKGMGQNY